MSVEQVRRVAQKDVLKDLNNYGLCARTHCGLGRQVLFSWEIIIAVYAYKVHIHTTRALTDYVITCRNTTWNAIVEVPNVEIARAVYGQPKAHKHKRTSPVTGTSHAGSSKHVTAALTASSLAEQQAKLSLHPLAEGASASSSASEGSTVEGSSNAAGSSGITQSAQSVTEGSGVPLMQRLSSAGGPPAELCPSGPPAKGRTWLKHQVAGHNLLASLAWNEEYLDSAAAYCRVPLSSSLDMASQNRQDGIQYRVGVHHVRTPSQLSDWGNNSRFAASSMHQYARAGTI